MAVPLIETELFDTDFDHHVIACDYRSQTKIRPDVTKIQAFCPSTDALIVTPNNPLIADYHEDIVSNSICSSYAHSLVWNAYGQEDFHRTLNTTGPNVFVKLLKNTEKQKNGSFCLKYKEEIIHFPPLRTLSKEFIQHASRLDGLTWVVKPVIKAEKLATADKSVAQVKQELLHQVIQSIEFEVKYLKALRLDMHIDELAEATGDDAEVVAENLITALLSEKVDISKILIVGLTFRFQQSLALCIDSELMTYTYATLPVLSESSDISEVFREVINCLSCKNFIFNTYPYSPNRYKPEYVLLPPISSVSP